MLDRAICGAKKKDGELCQRKVKPGKGPCFIHAGTKGQKVKSFWINETIKAIIGILTLFSAGGVATSWFYKSHFHYKPVTNIDNRTVNGTTSGPKSPAVVEKGAKVIYQDSPATPEKKK